MRPSQSVILAGGLGTRLHPLTLTRPKPMIDFCGKPFLEYLIVQLREQGFERVLLLLGYMPDTIMNYFGDGTRWGIKIDYSVTSPETLTGNRLKAASASLEETFLLLYCDNYCPISFSDMWERFSEANAPAMLTAYTNRDGYTRDNLSTDDAGMVVRYDRSRKSPGLKGVDIGYAILRRDLLSLLPAEDVLFEEAIYPALIAQRKLFAYQTDHRYYSVGSLERLPITEEFFSRRPTIILDRDGVLNRKPARAEYVRSWAEWEWLPGAHEALGLLGKNGYRIIIVSNQAGIARGAMTQADLEGIHDRMRREAAEAGGPIEGIFYCPHDWDAGCACRKPKPGMLFDAQRRFHLDLSRTVFVGDDERDREAGRAAGSQFVMVSEQTPLLASVRNIINNSGHTN